MSGTGRERKYDHGVRLISTTDLQGNITYANPEFCEVAGFTVDELIGRPHSVVRHPDMPPAAFGDLWTHAKDGKPWMGMVKNRCKNGDYYWVKAYVTPLFGAHGEKVGYQSVRTRPTDEQISRAESVYKKLNKKRVKIKDGNLASKLTIVGILSFLVSLLFIYLSPNKYIETSGILGSQLAFLSAVLFFVSPLKKLRKVAENTYNNALTKFVMSGKMNELGSAELAIIMQEARLRTVIGRVEDSIETLNHFMHETQQSIAQTSAGIEKQNLEADMLASAATEMSATAHEIAQNTSQTSHATQETADLANDGKTIVSNMIEGIHDLVTEVQAAGAASEELKTKAQAVESVVQIINEIAEQTNLLALNAAIEAARAGDHGRGFSVVADEVRVLAQRTQESTSEIKNTIEAIQNQVDQTTEVMERCTAHATDNINRAEDVGHSFEQVNGAMNSITDSSTQVAAASEEQSAVAEEVSQNIVSIREVAGQNHEISKKMTRSSEELSTLVKELKSMLQAI